MAYSQHIYTCVLSFMLLSFISNQLVEGRQLKHMKKGNQISFKDESKTKVQTNKGFSVDNDTNGPKHDLPRVNHEFSGKQEMPTSEKPYHSPALDESDAGYKDDFRPTTPGISPGVGHSFPPRENDDKTMQQTRGVGVRHVMTGNADDFRPTGPGHSPGVGHSLHNTVKDR
ncbi:precursor of CEP9-like [Impatiens glandulifera]|uniref:precursor of CEP9-like n=1 Tax=Impatiens glandulifera TaxID=253017 RepID=UPI001FB05E41|nr:precursor of CEP9-like [Impatiens glandulifera]